jgi:hypothetical protein
MSDRSTNSAADPSHDPPPQRGRSSGPPSSPTDMLEPVTRRGRLVPAQQAGMLDLQTEDGRFELLGPLGLDSPPREGEEVEVIGVPAPFSRSLPALLIRQVRRLD